MAGWGTKRYGSPECSAVLSTPLVRESALQALIAREPVERRPTIRAWLPRGFVPPQVTIVSTTPATDVLMVRSLESMVVQPRWSGDDVLDWRGDVFSMDDPLWVVAAPPPLYFTTLILPSKRRVECRMPRPSRTGRCVPAWS